MNGRRFKSLSLAFAVLASLAGCSNENPMSSPSTSNRSGVDRSSPRSSSAQTEIYGRVSTIDEVSRELTLVGSPTIVVVDDNAEIVFKDSGNESPLPFSEIKTGDSVEVRGDFQSGGSLLADRVRVRADDNPENEVELKGRVDQLDSEARQMTLIGNSTLINVLPTATIVLKSSGFETPIELSEIQPGDSVDVRGSIQSDGTLSADRVRLRDNDDFAEDIQFTDIITFIDYQGGIINVAGRTENILVDSGTYIFVKSNSDTASTGTAAKSGSGGGGDDGNRFRLQITLAHLMVGDTIEVHADIINASTLRAVAIELEDGMFDNGNEIEFKDSLLAVDTSAGLILFATCWIGEIVPETVLLGLNQEPLTLADFVTGDLVEIRGFLLSDFKIRVTMMRKDNNL